ncbi:sulfatase family protein [Seonamhaeicola marinus]|uniref:Sulfatase-like hydrolase/transferase n=1 Tax=Seonamhaeicola marinus TaxID=1912246 RepID=A0A5D0HMI9_9FLAO|nr:sulfatase-like hydrolase/transferase [Seonamhaeicola marinus]TYA71559.1 sulfatase-like hydrolase/transferase [Seonamhaeicola marinus]
MKRVILGLTLSFLLCNCQNQVEQQPLKPNVLFIMMDDLGYGQFGVYNDTVTTSDYDPYFVKLVDSLQGYSLEKSLEFSKTAIPTLSSLAKEGVIFNKAYTTSNICAPSRLGIATGMNNNRFGIYTNDDCEQSGLQKGTHLAEKIDAQGYLTAHIGKWHIGKRNQKMYDSILKVNNLDENTNYYVLGNSNPDVFKSAVNSGYIGSVVKEQHPLNNGFDYYYGYNHWACDFYKAKNVWENFKHVENQKEYNTDVFTDKALEVMETAIKDKKPFYVQLHYHAVHDSLEPKAPEKYFSKFTSGNYDLDNFYAHVNGVDENVKRVVDFLKSQEQYKNTIIVFTSDNGAMAGGSYDGMKTGSPLPGNTPFSGHKGNYHQGGFRVPMFISWPEGIKESKVESQMVSTMDILPTAIDAIGGDLPKNIQGKSLVPLLKGETKDVLHDHLVWSGLHAYKWGYLINKSTKTHMDESGFAPSSWVVIKGDYMLRFVGTLEKGIYYDFLEGRAPIFELFNIKNDPAENNDISDKHPELVEEMKALFYNEFKSFPKPVDWKLPKWEELAGEKV